MKKAHVVQCEQQAKPIVEPDQEAESADVVEHVQEAESADDTTHEAESADDDDGSDHRGEHMVHASDDVNPDAKHGEDDEFTVSVEKLPCYEMSYVSNGNVGNAISIKVYSELVVAGELEFVKLDASDKKIHRWLKATSSSHKKLCERPKGGDSGIHVIDGIAKLKLMRNKATKDSQRQGTSIAAVHKPSMYQWKKCALRNELNNAPEFVNISVCEDVELRVLPRSSRDQEVLWVCTEDIGNLVKFIKLGAKRSGAKCREGDEKLPRGVRKVIRKKGTVYKIFKSVEGHVKSNTYDTVDEAVQALEQA